MDATQTLPSRPTIQGIGLRWPFRYRGRSEGRDLRLDFLRGWCLFSMVIDHAVGNHQTFVLKVTGGGGYPMTGAHGFVFLSGTVFGLIYSRILASEGWSRALPKALKRALTLYGVAVGLGLLGLLFGLTAWGGGATPGDTFTVDNIVGTLLLHGANDSLMSFYFLMILLAPVALYAMQQGKTWLVIAASLATWLGHLYLPQHFGNPVEIFVPAAEWQLLFFAGLVIGYHRHTLSSWLQGARRAIYLAVLFTLFTALAILQFAYLTERTETLLPGQNLDWLAGQVYSDYDHNTPLHMGAILVAFLGLYHLVDWLWLPLKTVFGWFLIPIGGATLYVYIVHTIVVYCLLLNIPAFTGLDGNVLGFTLLGLMLVFWLMVKRRFLFQVVPK